MARRLLLVSLQLLFSTAGATAQTRPAPFETTDLTLTILTDVNQGVLQRDWNPGLAIGAGVAWPFYQGEVELGAQYAHPEARRAQVPGFRSLFVFAGWNALGRMRSRIEAHAGLRAGLLLMRFDGDTIPDFRNRESELGLAATAGLRYLLGAWHVDASGSYRAVFTRPRMEEVFLSIGLGRRFRSPRWLRDFLD
jgi:hypothetical protein